MAIYNTITGLTGPYAAGSLGRAWVKLTSSLARLSRGCRNTAPPDYAGGRFNPVYLSAVTQAQNEAADAWPLVAPSASPLFARLDLQLAILRETALIRDQRWGRRLENKALSAEFQALAQELEIIRLNFSRHWLRERPAA